MCLTQHFFVYSGNLFLLFYRKCLIVQTELTYPAIEMLKPNRISSLELIKFVLQASHPSFFFAKSVFVWRVYVSNH